MGGNLFKKNEAYHFIRSKSYFNSCSFNFNHERANPIR